MSKKEMLADLLDAILPDKFYRYLSLLNGNEQKLTVLAYHRIMDISEDFPFDIELISASCHQFDKQISYIAKYYNAITLEELVACIDGCKSLPKNALLITFDDGFDDNYENAFAILKKYKVPATIFISTDFISSGKTLWFDQLSYFILNIDNDTLKKIIINNFEGDIEISNRRKILEDVMEFLKVIPNDKRVKLIETLYSVNDFIYNDEHKKLSATLSWDQVREMDASLISFGSHTLSHPILSQLSDQNLRCELIDSKSEIEKQLNHQIHSIAYPVGTESAFTDKVLNFSQQAGYKLGFSYISGVNDWPIKNCFALKRLHIERYTSQSLFKGMLALPWLFSF